MYYKTEFIAILFGGFYVLDKVEFGGSFKTVQYTLLFMYTIYLTRDSYQS
jgi:hypothetical protein